MMALLFVIFTGVPLGILSTVLLDACQNSTNEAHAFKVVGSYNKRRVGICTCSIQVFFSESVPNMQQLNLPLFVYGDKCGYFVGRHEDDANNCTTCLDNSKMAFRRSENFTMYIERASDYHKNQFWFDLAIPPIQHDIWLNMDCWLDERIKKKPPCDHSKRNPRFDCNETSTSDQNVSVASECGDIDSRYESLGEYIVDGRPKHRHFRLNELNNEICVDKN